MRSLTRLLMVPAVVAAVAMAIDASSASASYVFSGSFTCNATTPCEGKTSWGPYGVAVDNSKELTAGDIYAIDYTNGLMEQFSSSGSLLSALSGPGEGSYATFKHPLSVAVGTQHGEVWVVDEGNGVVDKFSSAGAYEKVGIEGIPAEKFSGAYSVAVGPEGEVWVDDEAHKKIDKFNGTSGAYENVQLTEGETGKGTWALASVGDLAVDSHKNVYVVDTTTGHNVVDIFNSAGGFESELALPSKPSSVAIDPKTQDVYVGLGTSIAKYPPAEDVASHWTVPSSKYTTFGSSTQIKTTSAISINATTGAVYVADTSGKDIAIFELKRLPVAITGSAVPAASGTEALLEGEVNPEELATTSFFEWGTSIKYEATVDTTQAAGGPEPGNAADGEGEAVVPIVATLSELVPDTTYHYILKAHNTEGYGTGTDKSFSTGTIPPAVEGAISATSVVPSAEPGTVLFTGTVNPEHDQTNVHFLYGTTSALGEETPEVSAGEVYGEVEVGQQATELMPGTEYHYEFVAENAAGEPAVSPEGTFTTAPTPVAPTAESGKVSEVAETSATVSGSVDPGGIPTTYTWELSTSETACPGPSSVIGGGEAGSGTTSVPVQGSFNGLAPGVTYHYQIIASSEGGISCGQDRTFATPAYTFALTQPLTPGLVATPTFSPEPEPATTTTPKALTRAQKLARALKACKKRAKKNRAKCEKAARAKSRSKGKAKAKKQRKKK